VSAHHTDSPSLNAFSASQRTHMWEENPRQLPGYARTSEVSMDRIRIGYPAGYLRFFWIRIEFGYLFLKKIRSGQDQDICLISMTKSSWEWFKMSQMMMLLFSLLWFLYSQKIKMVLSEGYVLHSSQSMIINLCYFIVKIFCRGGSSKLLLNCWYAALLWWVAYVCVV